MRGATCGQQRSDSGAPDVLFHMAPWSLQQKATRIARCVLTGQDGCLGITATVPLTGGLILLIGGGAAACPQAIVRAVAHEPLWPT